MPAKDFFHEEVREALQRDGWEITHDPYKVEYEDLRLAVDLGAEKLIAAEKDSKKIAVEIKSFLSKSFIYEFHEALGQFLNYRWILKRTDVERELFLAVSQDVYDAYFPHALVQGMMEEEKIQVIVFKPQEKEISKWIKPKHTEDT